MIKDPRRKVTTDPRGKITAGRKNEVGEMEKLDYFNVSKFPELLEAYGLKPTAIVVFPPSDRILDFFDDEYSLWGAPKTEGAKGVKKRSCDGERCIHRTAENVAGHQYAAGEETACICKDLPLKVERNGKEINNPDRCRYHACLKVFIADPRTGKIENPHPYEFHTHGETSGRAVKSELEKVELINKDREIKLAGVPMMLSVRMAEGKDDARKKYPTWTLRVLGTVSDIQKGRFLAARENFLLPGAEDVREAVFQEPPQDVAKATKRAEFLELIKHAKDRDRLSLIYKRFEEVWKGGQHDMIAFEYDEVIAAIKKRADDFKPPAPRPAAQLMR